MKKTLQNYIAQILWDNQNTKVETAVFVALNPLFWVWVCITFTFGFLALWASENYNLWKTYRENEMFISNISTLDIQGLNDFVYQCETRKQKSRKFQLQWQRAKKIAKEELNKRIVK